MIRALLASAAVVAAIFAAADSRAQEAAPPRFFIERIEVRNHKRVSPDVVIAESRLRAGNEYAESDLRDASTRLARLPFLLGAEFALERGSERGRHILVINIIETRSFFYQAELVPIYTREGRGTDVGDVSHLGTDETSAAAGYRWFLGRRGALHVALVGREDTELTSGYSAFVVGYTMYDVLGTRGFVTVNIKQSRRVSPQIVAGMPLSLNQTVTLEYDENIRTYDYTVLDTVIDRSRTERVARATWSYNTTNHPFFPTNGTLLSVAPLVIWRDGVGVTTTIESNGVSTVRVEPTHLTAIGVQATAVRYFELTDRTSVSGGMEIGVASSDRRRSGEVRFEQTTSAAFANGQATVSRSLWSPERRAQGGDSRIEFEMRVRARQDSYPDFEATNSSLRTSISWLRQSSWGNVRLGVGYAW